MNTAIILRSLNEQECETLLKDQKTSSLVLFTDNLSHIPKAFQKQLKLRFRELSKEDYAELYGKLLNDVVELGHHKFNGTSIAEILKLGDHSFWYYLRFALFHRSLSDFKRAKYVDWLLTENAVEACRVYTKGSDFMTLLNTQVPVVVKPVNQVAKKEVGFLFKYAVIFFSRACVGFFKMGLKKQKNKHLMVLNQDQQDIIDLDTLKVVKGDPHLSYLADMAAESTDFIFLSQLKPPGISDNHTLSWKSLRDSKYHHKTIYFESFLLLAFFRPSLYRQLSKCNNAISQLRNLQKGTAPSQHYLIDKMIQAKQLLYMAVHRENSAEFFFKNVQAASIGGVNEHSLQMKALFNSAGKKGIKTYGIQHGGVSANNIFYAFNDQDIPYQPWPDFTLLRGNYTAKMLSTSSCFPENSLKVVGHMRTDAIEKLQGIKVQEVFPKLNKEVKIVLYATQGFPISEAETIKKQIADVFQTVQSLPDHHLVIKPHPNESNYGYYHEIAAQFNCSNYEVLNSDLYRLLAVSDVLLTYYSTVGTEAVYFDKPLIVLDYTNRDAQGFIRQEVGVAVANRNQLKNAIEHPVKANSDKRQLFISKRAFKIDGQSTKRHFDFIRSFSK